MFTSVPFPRDRSNPSTEKIGNFSASGTTRASQLPAPSRWRGCRAAVVMPSRKSEYKVSEVWDRCAENFFFRTGSSALVGAVLGAVLFRTCACLPALPPPTRARTGVRGSDGCGLSWFAGSSARVVTALGAGFGAGVSYMECKLAFEQPDFKMTPFTFKKITIPQYKRPSSDDPPKE